MARGRQLTLEEEYAKNGAESDQLFDELSQAASDSDFELEELIDSYINERSELERLEKLREKGEVSDRVYDRLVKEYDEKLDHMNEKINTGINQLQGYKAQIELDLTESKNNLETINARLLIGDEESDIIKQKKMLTEKIEHLNYALVATEHILKKESIIRNGPLTRFEVTETTLADTHVTSSKPIEDEKSQKEEASEEPKASSSETETANASVITDAESGKICPTCGRVTASEAHYCIHCGGQL